MKIFIMFMIVGLLAGDASADVGCSTKDYNECIHAPGCRYQNHRMFPGCVPSGDGGQKYLEDLFTEEWWTELQCSGISEKATQKTNMTEKTESETDTEIV